MRKIVIEITTENAIFKDNPLELATLLQNIANLANPHTSPELDDYPIFDSNGNRVGGIHIFND